MRVILVPLVGDDHDQIALAAAYAVAAPFRAHVEALFVRPDLIESVRDLEVASAEMIGEVTRASAAVWDQRSAIAEQAFETTRAAANATVAEHPTTTGDAVTTRWLVVEGEAAEVFAEAARLADLVVLAGLHTDDDRKRRPWIADVLIRGGRPILLMPDGGSETIGRTIAVAWNGSAEAARAVAAAMPMLRRAEAIHVLTAAGPHVNVKSGHGLADYLGWNGIASAVHEVYPESNAGASLLAKCGELGADLLVMGGYGRSRMRELIFGGVTHHVLAHHELPVLLIH